jgi:hypothetical protein
MADDNDELKLDPQNARRHSERNAAMVRQSLQEVGPFRSIAVDGDNVIRAGNLTYQEAQALGLKTRVIEAAPDELIVVKRPDLRGDAARRAGLWDNRTGDPDVGSEWDPEVLAQMMAEKPALLEGLWQEGELALLGVGLESVEFPEYDESVGDEVEWLECPECGHRWPK